MENESKQLPEHVMGEMHPDSLNLRHLPSGISLHAECKVLQTVKGKRHPGSYHTCLLREKRAPAVRGLCRRRAMGEKGLSWQS